jgi:hypothetical protein
MSWQDAAAMVGVHRNVISIWKAKGDAHPQSAYGVFLKSAEEAELRREQVHLKFISQDKDWKARRWLLCNFNPSRYRMNTFSGELSGVGGTPLVPPGDNAFLFKLELHEPAAAPEEETQVSIIAPDGSRTIWNGPGESQAQG